MLTASPILLLAALTGLIAAVPASALEAMPEVPVTLIAAGGPPEDGAYRAGLAFDLPEGWHTYWISPGDAGMPPVIDTSGSDNLADLAVAYPLPKRYDDGVSVSFVYEGRLVLPLRAKPADAGKPVHLRLAVAIGLCRDVCLPVNAEIDAVLDAAAPPDATASADIAAFEALVPKPDADPEKRLALEVVAADKARGEAKLAATVTGEDVADLFALAPAPWSALPPTPKGGDGDRRTFEVVLYGPRGGEGLDDLALTFVVVDKAGATTLVRQLD